MPGLSGSGRKLKLLFLLALQVLQLQAIFSSDAFLRIKLQHSLQQLYSVLVQLPVHLSREVNFEGYVGFVDFLVATAVKQVGASQQDVEQCSRRKDVAGHIDVLVFAHGDDFGGDEAGSAAAIEVVRLVFANGSQSEVDQHGFPAVLGHQHDVLQFDVPVHHPETVYVGERLQQTSHNLFAVLLAHFLLPLYALEEVAAGQVLCDHKQRSLRLHYVFHL